MKYWSHKFARNNRLNIKVTNMLISFTAALFTSWSGFSRNLTRSFNVLTWPQSIRKCKLTNLLVSAVLWLICWYFNYYTLYALIPAELATVASEFRTKLGNLKRKRIEETECNRADNLKAKDDCGKGNCNASFGVCICWILCKTSLFCNAVFLICRSFWCKTWRTWGVSGW